MKLYLFLAGFRLFFFAAASYAVIAMLAWLAWLAIHAMNATVPSPTFAAAPHFWHGHEMIFGYAGAVLAGFFLTALPGWAGTPQARSAFVASAGAVWLAGRAAVWFSAYLDPYQVAVLDLSFLPLLSWRIASNLAKRPKPQNVALLGLLAVIFLGNLLIHLEWTELTSDTAERGLWLALLGLCAFIAVIGGRVTPAFTRNALVQAGEANRLPVTRPLADRAGIASAALVGPLYAAGAPEVILGFVAVIAAVSNGIRLAGWRSAAALGNPILWALHLGFALLVTGYALLAFAWFTGLLHPIAAMHGLAIGAVGSMTLAMMTRAPLGHTGRPLVVPKAIIAAYLFVPAAMLLRVAGPELFPDRYNEVMFASGMLWIAGFAIYLATYWPVLAGPDARGDPQS